MKQQIQTSVVIQKGQDKKIEQTRQEYIKININDCRLFIEFLVNGDVSM